MTRMTIPVGPQHPVLKEPLGFTLTVEGETILDSVLRIGYVHRGIERLSQERNYIQNLHLMERICGICSHVHTTTYCQGVEALLGLEVPIRGLYLRTLLCELERIHSHLLWLGVLAENIGLSSVFMYAWRDREIVLDIMEELSGGRVAHSANVVGGVRIDMEPEQVRSVSARVDQVERLMDTFLGVIRHERSFRARTRHVGYLSPSKCAATVWWDRSRVHPAWTSTCGVTRPMLPTTGWTSKSSRTAPETSGLAPWCGRWRPFRACGCVVSCWQVCPKVPPRSALRGACLRARWSAGEKLLAAS